VLTLLSALRYLLLLGAVVAYGWMAIIQTGLVSACFAVLAVTWTFLILREVAAAFDRKVW